MRTLFARFCAFLTLLSLGACLSSTPTTTSTTASPIIPAVNITATEKIPPSTSTSAPTEALTLLPLTATFTPVPTPTLLPWKWEQIYAGRAFPRDTVTAIIVDPINADILYIGAENSGVYKSVNGGKNWQSASTGLRNLHVQALVIDPQNPATLYLGTQFSGVFKTSDGAQTWQPLNQGLDLPMNMSNLVIDPQNPKQLYYAGWNGIFASKNGGAAWEKVSNERVGHLVMNPKSGYLLMTRHNQAGTYQSSDGGQSWRLIGPPGAENCTQEGNVWFDTLNGDKIFAQSCGKSGDQALFITSDHGQSWQSYEIQWPPCLAMTFGTQITHSAFCGCANGQIRQISLIESNWSYLSHAGDDPVYSIQFVPESSQIFAGTSGLYSMPYGGTKWTARNTGLGLPELEFLHSPKSGELFLKVVNSRSDNGWLWQKPIYRSKDQGRSWALYWDNSLAFDADGQTLYQIDLGQNMLRSQDRGKNWESIQPDWLDIHSSAIIFAHPAKPGHLLVFYAGQGQERSYVSTDWGSTWSGSALDKLDVNFARAFFDPGSSGIVYAADRSQVLISKDDGQNWQSCHPIDAELTETDSTLAIDPTDNQHLFVATKWNGILTSRDGCQTWQNISQGLKNFTVNALVIDPNNPKTVYAGTDDGAYAFIGEGQSWQPIMSGLPEPPVIYSLYVDKRSNVYGSTSFGIFQLVKP
jgi:photosystem II stability/assembly factor-like uncharacterized protein